MAEDRTPSPSMDDPASAIPPSLRSALDQTERVTFRLRYMGLWIFALTLVSVVAMIVEPLRVFVPSFVALFVLADSIIALILLAMRDYARRQGDSLFAEITDELHWDVERTYSTPLTSGTPPETRPDILVRLALRKYAQSTDMPLVKGNLGQAFYATLNLSAMLAATLLSRIGSLKF